MLRMLNSSKFMAIVAAVVLGTAVYYIFGGKDLPPEMKVELIRRIITLLGICVGLFIGGTALEDAVKKANISPLDLLREGYEAVKSLSSKDPAKIKKEFGDIINLLETVTRGGGTPEPNPFTGIVEPTKNGILDLATGTVTPYSSLPVSMLEEMLKNPTLAPELQTLIQEALLSIKANGSSEG